VARGNAELGERRKFAAFISYSHADAAAAAKLQRKLERYRLPKHIRRSQAREATGLGRIFRDREDLAAAVSLSDAIRAAIADAEALIVICSPDAAISQWVAAEIALFRKLHPERPVLAAIVRGDPTEAFPAALTEGGREPLAADLRREGDGGSLGFLKIVAGIAGVPLDTLVQRDAQRRVARVTWITLGALTAMLIMGIMTTLALSARNEAARQRASAEGLVEYMLTDLREKLKGVGRLDVMEGVNKRAMEYYGDDTVNGQLLKARVLHAQGDDDLRRGNVKSAFQKLLTAEDITGNLYRRHPQNPDAVFAHAQSNFWLGYSKEVKSDMPGALREKAEYSRLAQEYAKLSNGSRQAQKEVGWSHNTLGAAYFQNPATLANAISHFEKYLDIFSQLVAAEPEDSEARYSLMDANAWMADALLAKDDLEAALNHRQEQVRHLDILTNKDPKNLELRLRRGIALRGLARVYKKQGKLMSALTHVDLALEQLDQKHGFDRANVEWRSQRISMHLDRGLYGAAMRRTDIVSTAQEQAAKLLAVEAQLADRSVEYSKQNTLLRKLSAS
jgi:tetratricopeptide (TPR) repeat protein